MSDVMVRPRAIPLSPPADRAPAVIAARPVLERELNDLRLRIAEATLAATEGKPDGRKNLAALHNEIHTVVCQLDGNAAAHELAQRLDREAVAAWRTAVQANPDAATEGITKTECCKRCSPEHGCAITGAQCGHPVLVGHIGPRLTGDQKVRAVFRAAVEKLETRR